MIRHDFIFFQVDENGNLMPLLPGAKVDPKIKDCIEGAKSDDPCDKGFIIIKCIYENIDSSILSYL